MTASPLIRQLQETAAATFITYGPPASSAAASPTSPAPPPVEIVDTFGEYQAEYAAIRKGVGIFHLPQVGAIEVRGKERGEFLHRMTTADTRGLKPGEVRRAFLLNTKGRITADMLIVAQEDRMLVALDVFQAAPVVATLDRMLFSEDVQLRNVSSGFVAIALHGPAGFKLLAALGARWTDDAAEPLAAMRNAIVPWTGTELTVYRRDDTGSLGLHLLVPAEAADRLYAQLAEAVGGLVPEVESPQHKVGAEAREKLGATTLTPALSLKGRGGQDSAASSHNLAGSHIPVGGVDPKRSIPGRGIGWLAFNTARIEAGVPLYHVDFGPDSLPGETALLKDAVSFTKGCYVGQEIVARMAHLGHPKRIVVGFRCEDDRMPVAGSQVFDANKEGEIVGAVSSSTLSPLLGNVAIGLASMKWGKHAEGTPMLVPAEGALVKAIVCALPIAKVPGGV